MDAINLGAFLTFALVAIFTPGPNNITCSSMGILYGYQKTLKYIAGIVTGFFTVMLLAGIISGTLYAIFPSLEVVMRLVGALYIGWLAYKTFKSSHEYTEESAPMLGYGNGLLLQALNPKGLVFGLTLYTTFLAPITDNVILLVISALFLSSIAFCATSTWAVSGAMIKRYLANPTYQKAINTFLAILLILTAIDLSGIFH